MRAWPSGCNRFRTQKPASSTVRRSTFLTAHFDLTFSVCGAVVFTDWQAGLAEQARVLRTGGRGCVATWREPPGGAPFHIMAEAMRMAFPERGYADPSFTFVDQTLFGAWGRRAR